MRNIRRACNAKFLRSRAAQKENDVGLGYVYKPKARSTDRTVKCRFRGERYKCYNEGKTAIRVSIRLLASSSTRRLNDCKLVQPLRVFSIPAFQPTEGLERARNMQARRRSQGETKNELPVHSFNRRLLSQLQRTIILSTSRKPKVIQKLVCFVCYFTVAQVLRHPNNQSLNTILCNQNLRPT